MRIVLSLLAALIVVAGAAEAQLRTVPQSAAQVQLSFAPVVTKAAPAVVNVYARRIVRQAINPFFQDFFGAGPLRNRVEQSLGSGVIVKDDGVIITNNHVIEGGEEIQIALPDRREYEARVLLADPRSDLAVLKIDTKGEKLPFLEFGDSDQLQVGDLVLAIGDPFGVGETVTSGIVSALARSNGGASDFQFFIQTDAAINPGNSGGALVTLDGKVVGINTSIVTAGGRGSIGIGFAIPANMAKIVVEGALGGGIKRPWIGADGQAVTADIARGLGMTRPEGVLISDVYPGGPAAAAGIQRGDVVLSIDGFAVDNPQGMRYRVVTKKEGDIARVRYLRQGAMREANVRIALPSDAGREEATISGQNPMQGARVANVTPALADELQMNMMARGVVVLAVDGRSPAARFGFRAGDQILQVNGARIGTVAELNRSLASADGWRMVLQRGDQTINFAVR